MAKTRILTTAAENIQPRIDPETDLLDYEADDDDDEGRECLILKKTYSGVGPDRVFFCRLPDSTTTPGRLLRHYV